MTLEKKDININKQNLQKNVDYTNKIIICIPDQDLMQKKYNYTQSTYLTNSRQVFSASTGGTYNINKCFSICTFIGISKYLCTSFLSHRY